MKNVKSRIKALFILVFAAIALTLGSCSLDHGPVDSSKLDTYKVVFIFNDAAGTVVSTKELEVVKGETLLVSQIPQIRDQLKADGYEIPSSYDYYWVLLNDKKEPIDLDPEAEVNNLLNITEAICDNQGKVYVQVAYKQFGGTVSFFSNGGSPVEAIVDVEVGQSLQGKQPADPTKVGYTFVGWYDKTLTNLFDWNTLLPEEGIQLYAKWEANEDTAYLVEHYLEALDGSYKLEKAEKLAGTTDAKVVAKALEVEGFTHDAKHPEALESAEVLADGSLVLRVYYARNSYTVTFDAAGGDAKASQEYKYGQVLDLGYTLRTGYTFAGWLLNGKVFNEETMPAKDLELTASWIEGQGVTYKVEHYFEALDGSYVKDAKVETLFGSTGSKVEAALRNVAGFEHNEEHKDALESAEVLADGSLVLRVYYARSVYTVSFDAMGGVAKEAQEYKYGQALNLGETTKVGYTFDKWLYQGNALVIANMPAYDMELTAVWAPNKDTAYLVEHYFEQLDGSYKLDAKVDELEGTTDAKVSAVARKVTGFTHDPKHASAYETAYVLADGSLVLKVYYSRNVYTLTVNVDGAKQEVEYAYEEKVATPASPSKVGYTFANWSPVVPATMPAEDVEVVAEWTVNQYTLTINVDGVKQEVEYDYNEAVETPASPSKTGYTFAGWSPVVPATMPAEDVEVVAQWTVNQYTLTINVDGVKQEVEYDYNEAVETPASPSKTGYTFAGWSPVVPATMPAEDVEVVAQWTVNQYTLTINVDGVKQEVEYDYNEAVETPASPSKTGYTFAGWSPVVPATMPAEDVEVVAQWTVNQYTLTINVDGVKQEVEYDYNEAVETPASPSKTGYTFAGWSPVVPATMPAEDVEVVAQWTVNQYTLTINVDGVKQEVKYDYLEAVATPASPEKAGYTFTGWTPAVPATMPAEDVEVVAEWTINQYNISFDLNGGASVTIDNFAAEIIALFNASDEAGSKVVTKATFHSNSHPNIKGVYNKAENLEAHKWLFEFVKAEILAIDAEDEYVKETVEMLDKMIAGDTTAIGSGSYANGRTLYRHFIHNLINKNHEAVNSAYTKFIPDFTLAENQAKVIALLNDFDETLYYGEAIVAPTNPVKLGYVFAGWSPAVPATMPAEDMVYVAQWNLENYSISFDLNGGMVDSELMEQGFFGDPSKVISFNTYSNTGLASDIYFCDPSVTGSNSLRWQYKILLKYNSELKAYEVVAVDAATATISNVALTAGVEWTHAIASASVKVNTYATVGQYLVLSKDVVVGDTAFTGSVYDLSQYKSGMKSISYTINDEVELTVPTREGYKFIGWYDNTDNLVEKISTGTIGNIELTAKWLRLNTISFDLAGGTVADEYMIKYMDGAPSYVFSFSSYSNTGLAEGIYFCDTGVTAHNSLRWQYKILLKYNGKLNAYEVVAVDAATASINNAASAAGVEWTHAIASASVNVTSNVQVGQYIVLSKNAVNGDTNFTGSAYALEQFKEKVKDIEFTMNDSVELIVPEKDGFMFIGWYDEADNYISSIPVGTEKDFVLTAKWGSVNTITLNPNEGYLSDEWYYVVINGDSKKDIQISKYDNTGLAEGIYFCDKGVIPHNSLRWQYKILLKYNSNLNAYEVVAVDAAKASANNAAAAAGVEWTHAIASAGTDVSTYVAVGQYISLNKKVALGDANFIASSYDASQFETKIKEIRHISTETVALPIPVNTGYKFLGWFDESDNLITVLDSSITADHTLTAKWVETNEIELSEADEAALTALGSNPDLFVKSGLIRELCVMNGKEYQLNATCFTTLAAALAAAKENDIIYVFAGTYAEALTISVANIKLIGPNYNIKGNATRAEEAIITGAANISAANVTLNGLKFESSSALAVTGNNIVIDNCYITSSSSHALDINAAISGFTFTNTTLYSTNNGVKGIYSTSKVSNVNISNNTIINTSGSSASYPDAIRLQSIAGNINIENNYFNFPGGNFTVFLGSSAIAENTIINFKHNTITSTNGNNASGVSFRNIKASCTLNIIGNTFKTVGGTVIEVRGSSSSDLTTATTVNVKNNAIIDTSTNVRFNIASTNLVIDSNYAYKNFAFNANGVTASVTNAKADANSALSGAM